MSNVKAELEQIRTVRRSLEKLRLKLLRPTVAGLESGLADLVTGLECLKRLEPVLALRDRRSGYHEQDLALEVAGLRRELQQINALMDAAGKFYEGWSRLLSAADDGAANYTPKGKTVVPISPQSNNLVVMHG